MNEPFQYLNKAGSAKFTDRHIKKAADLLQNWDGKEIKGAALIGAPLSKPSISHSGASFTPNVIRNLLQSYTTYAIDENRDLNYPIVDCGDIYMHVTDLIQSQERIQKTVEELCTAHPQMIPILLGGDHSVSYPSIEGFAKAKGKVGIIQFDAHHDLRNLEDGGPSNGTPFRSLIESRVVKGDQLVQIGIRNFSNSQIYRDYAQEQGVTVYTMRDVRNQSIQAIIHDSIELLKNKVDVIYVSVDMDVLDQSFAPGCPAIGPGGMDSQTLLDAIHLLGEEKLVQAMDIVEIDPTLDFRDMTSRIAVHVILTFLLSQSHELTLESEANNI
ncbi:formimidoylglutamase [Chengkuizengella axinellae]|uniref:Formimidoylglutamase n=1 Tax=Chengkuizengella axinellae TaxID=3064388 RepID=A0ABT9J2X2_9BACL|nr:formimidoylglutamase [Chengkuizengella sp. 2205SS18-9]MDP5275959.1 formimidoylglutamase [Chengkuizengella sp. 2205SS18-9]